MTLQLTAFTGCSQDGRESGRGVLRGSCLYRPHPNRLISEDSGWAATTTARNSRFCYDEGGEGLTSGPRLQRECGRMRALGGGPVGPVCRHCEVDNQGAWRGLVGGPPVSAWQGEGQLGRSGPKVGLSGA